MKLNNKRLIDGIGIITVAVCLIMMLSLMKQTQVNSRYEQASNYQYPLPIDEEKREWREIFLKEKKVGYSVSSLTTIQDGYFLQEEIFLRLNLMGFPNDVHTVIQASLDHKYLLQNFLFRMTSGVIHYGVNGQVEGEELILESPFNNRTQRIKLRTKPLLGAGLGFYFKGKEIKVGDRFIFPLFDPATKAQQNTAIRVTARERVEINRKQYTLFRLETELWGQPMKFWVDEQGQTMKEEGFMGLTVIRSSAANAPLDLDHGDGIDFYELASVKANRDLPNPEKLKYLSLQLTGLERASIRNEIINSGRQSFKNNILEVRKEDVSGKGVPSLSSLSQIPDIGLFLRPEFNIESDHPEIIKQSKKIIGQTDNPLGAVQKILNWVYEHLEKKPVVTVPSALEVLHSRVGDCNEHATLTTALLRASGIPSKICVGLMYTRGRFFYHAWNEAYVGYWISLDATINQMPADVTHIKLIEGNLSEQVQLTGIMGVLKITVLDYAYD